MFENILFIVVCIFSVIIAIVSTVNIVNTKNMKNVTCANCKNLILLRSSFSQKIVTCLVKDHATWWKSRSVTNGCAEKCRWFEENKNNR